MCLESYSAESVRGSGYVILRLAIRSSKKKTNISSKMIHPLQFQYLGPLQPLSHGNRPRAPLGTTVLLHLQVQLHLQDSGLWTPPSHRNRHGPHPPLPSSFSHHELLHFFTCLVQPSSFPNSENVFQDHDILEDSPPTLSWAPLIKHLLSLHCRQQPVLLRVNELDGFLQFAVIPALYFPARL